MFFRRWLNFTYISFYFIFLPSCFIGTCICPQCSEISQNVGILLSVIFFSEYSIGVFNIGNILEFVIWWFSPFYFLYLFFLKLLLFECWTLINSPMFSLLSIFLLFALLYWFPKYLFISFLSFSFLQTFLFLEELLFLVVFLIYISFYFKGNIVSLSLYKW